MITIYKDNKIYLAKDIRKLADNMAMHNTNKNFNALFSEYVKQIVKDNLEDCCNNHLSEIKAFLEFRYNAYETKCKDFNSYVSNALEDYLYHKIINCIEDIAFNCLTYHCVYNNIIVSPNELKTIAENANAYTSPQELIDNLHSLLGD